MIFARDDPVTRDLKPNVLRDYLDQSGNTRSQIRRFDLAQQAGLDPEEYCQCEKCTYKPTLEESFCCKSMKMTEAHQGNICFSQLEET